MKSTIYKLAGVNNDKDFYKKFPSEASFMKKHGKAFKKAQDGMKVPKSNNTKEYLPMYQDAGNVPAFNKMNIKGSAMSNMEGGMAVAGDLISGVQGIMQQKEKKLAEATQNRMVSGLSLQAANFLPEPEEFNFVRPEDMQFNQNQLAPSYGSGTNVLTAQDGKKITYAQNGMSGAGYSAMGDFANKMTTPLYGGSAGSELGGTIGGAAGSLFGLGGKIIGEHLGKAAGYVLDSDARSLGRETAATERNMNGMMGANFRTYNTSTNGGFLQDGGEAPLQKGQVQVLNGGKAETISYNPFIEGSGEVVKLIGDKHRGKNGMQGGMDIKINSMEQNIMQNNGTMQDGGNMEIADVKAEGGETVTMGKDSAKIDGNLHIPLSLAEAMGDPKIKGKKFKNQSIAFAKKETKANKTKNKHMVSLDDLTPRTRFDKLAQNSHEASIKGSDMTLETIAENREMMSATQEKLNTISEEFGIDANALSRGKIKEMKGFTPSNKTDTAMAMNGKKLPTYQNGGEEPYANGGKLPMYQNSGQVKKEVKLEKKLSVAEAEGLGYEFVEEDSSGKSIYKLEVAGTPEEKRLISKGKAATKGVSVTTKGKTVSMKQAYKNRDKNEYPESMTFEEYAIEADTQKKANPEMYADYEAGKLDKTVTGLGTAATDDVYETIAATDGYSDTLTFGAEESGGVPPPEKPKWYETAIKAANTLAPAVRGTNQSDFNYNQAMGEMFAMSNNQLEPVQSQNYNPQLDTPYDISLQAQRNQVNSDSRSAQRMMGYNPAAQSAVAAQAYNAKNQINEKEFMANQSMRDKVFAGNRATMNDAQLKNLSINDQQYQRQAQAKSNTKATTQSALNSLSGKYAQHALENRTLGVYENMYNYRFGKDGRALNRNDAAQFDYSGDNGVPQTADQQIASTSARLEQLKADRKKSMKAAGGIQNATGSGQNGKTIKKPSLVRSLKLYN